MKTLSTLMLIAFAFSALPGAASAKQVNPNVVPKLVNKFVHPADMVGPQIDPHNPKVIFQR